MTISHVLTFECDKFLPYLDESVADLPAEDTRVGLLVVLDALLHLRGGYPRLTTPYNAWANAASLLVTVQYLRHTAV